MTAPTRNGYRWRGLAAMLVGTFSVVLSLTFLFSGTPVIMRDLGISIETVAWLSLAYALGAAVFEPMWGRFGDLHGRKRNALFGLGFFTVGAIVCALSPDVWTMVGARFIQGLGGAAIIPIGMAFIGENFPAEERGRALGLWGMVSGAAPGLGPTLGGYLIDWFGWRSIFWLSALLGLAGIGVIALVVRESRSPRSEPFDLSGSVLLFLSAGSLLVAVNQGRSWGWTSALTLGFVGSFALFLAVFLAAERRASHPLVDLSVVRTRTFLTSGVIVFVSFLAFQGSFFLIPFFLQQVQRYPPSQTGQLVIPLFVGIMVASLVSGPASDRVGSKGPALLGTALMALALYFLSLVQPNTDYLSLMGVMLVLGVGIGATLPPLSRAITGSVPLRQIGAASGIFNLLRNMGGPFGIAIAASVFAQRAPAVGLTSAFDEVALLLLGVSSVAIAAALTLKDSRRRVPWTSEAEGLLRRFPGDVRRRARIGMEKAARTRGMPSVTRDLVLEVGRGWKSRTAPAGNPDS